MYFFHRFWVANGYKILCQDYSTTNRVVWIIFSEKENHGILTSKRNKNVFSEKKGLPIFISKKTRT
jgi:hypothetical protein